MSILFGGIKFKLKNSFVFEEHILNILFLCERETGSGEERVEKGGDRRREEGRIEAPYLKAKQQFMFIFLTNSPSASTCALADGDV